MTIADFTPDELAAGFERMYERATYVVACDRCGKPVRGTAHRRRCAVCHDQHNNELSNANTKKRRLRAKATVK